MLPIKLELPEHFLDEEVRYGYTVTEKMKKVWAVELDLLNEFQKVCNQYNLKYYAIAGTLLGAVRHQGFIPWDDDVDVVMFREDYDKLISIASSVFSAPYDFMASGKIEHFFRGHAQLRNRMTTGILPSELKQKFSYNQGIWIDIFPLDGVPEENKKECFTYYKLRMMKKCLRNRVRITHEKLKNKILHIHLYCAGRRLQVIIFSARITDMKLSVENCQKNIMNMFHLSSSSILHWINTFGKNQILKNP